MCPSPEGEGAEEDRARAGYYALLARLLYSGPDAALLATLARSDEIAEDPGSGFAGAWNALVAAAGAMDAEAARAEHDEVFVGVGKAEVTPYASYYLSETGREKTLVRLKQQLAGMGLERAGHAREPEDHFAGLFEVMRHLISDPDDAALQKQKAFFAQFIAPAYAAFCGAISECPKANFYKHVARFSRHFLDIESDCIKVF